MESLWLCGRFVGETPSGNAWDFQGIFSSEEKAVQACRDYSYWVAPVTLDAELPHETISDWPGAYYPNVGKTL